jgi:hypothetical protein
MHRSLSRLCQKLAEEIAVKTGEDEPLGSSRRAGNDVDVLSPEPTSTDEPKRNRAGKQSQKRHPDEKLSGGGGCKRRSARRALRS